MDEFKILMIAAIPIILIAAWAGFAAGYDYFINDDIRTIEGIVIDSEYSQSGVGSNDITVLYFDDGRTIIFSETIEINRNTPLIITYKEYKFMKNKAFIDVEYLS